VSPVPKPQWLKDVFLRTVHHQIHKDKTGQQNAPEAITAPLLSGHIATSKWVSKISLKKV
jgi:hypothetical protein